MEIIRLVPSQLWQWVHCNASTDKGLLITEGYIDKLIEEEVTEIQNIVTNTPMLSEAVSLFKELILNTVFEDFLTIPAYKLIK